MATEADEGVAAARALGGFRIAFGLIVATSALRTLALGRVATHYLDPTYHFTYPGLEALGWGPPAWTYARFGLVIVCGVALALGRGARLWAAGIAVLFTWNHLVDKSLYLNHYHLVSLLAATLAVVPSDGAFVAGRPARALDPRGLRSLQVLFGLVWFHAGLAKLHPDWLVAGQPLQLWLAELGEGLPGEALLAQPAVAVVASWLALAHDLTIPFLLAWRRTRRVAFGCAVVFHLATACLFPVGIFPYVMLAGAALFLDWAPPPTRVASAQGAPVGSHREVSPPVPWSRGARIAAGLFLTVQAVLPLRGLAVPGDLLWHESGFRFSWRVMVMEKRGDLRYVVESPGGRAEVVDPRERLTPLQVRMLSTQPDMILQFAHALADDHQRRGGVRPRVRAEAWVSLNGSDPGLLIDPQRDLAALPLGAAVAHYVRPRPAPRRDLE